MQHILDKHVPNENMVADAITLTLVKWRQDDHTPSWRLVLPCLKNTPSQIAK